MPPDDGSAEMGMIAIGSEVAGQVNGSLVLGLSPSSLRGDGGRGGKRSGMKRTTVPAQKKCHLWNVGSLCDSAV